MEYRNLVMIGTSHIAKQSLKEVKDAIEVGKPDIVCLELDPQRYHGLLNEKKKGKIRIYDIKRIGIKGFVFSLIGAWAEKKLGDTVGVSPGSEMKVAIKLAKKYNLKIGLIDQHIEVTLKKLSKAISWKEKWNFVVDIFKAVVLRKKEIEFDLTTVPTQEVIDKLVGQVKVRYPNIYKVLVKDRNKVMAKNLARLMANHPDKKILAIVGAGHEEDMLKIIKKNTSQISYTYTIG